MSESKKLQLNVVRIQSPQPIIPKPQGSFPISSLDMNIGPKSLTGKAAQYALQGLTAEQRIEHRRNKERERNMRRQEKINFFRELEYLPTNKQKILLLLFTFNPCLQEVDSQLIENNVNTFLESMALI